MLLEKTDKLLQQLSVAQAFLDDRSQVESLGAVLRMRADCLMEASAVQGCELSEEAATQFVLEQDAASGCMSWVESTSAQLPQPAAGEYSTHPSPKAPVQTANQSQPVSGEVTPQCTGSMAHHTPSVTNQHPAGSATTKLEASRARRQLPWSAGVCRSAVRALTFQAADESEAERTEEQCGSSRYGSRSSSSTCSSTSLSPSHSFNSVLGFAASSFSSKLKGLLQLKPHSRDDDDDASSTTTTTGRVSSAGSSPALSRSASLLGRSSTALSSQSSSGTESAASGAAFNSEDGDVEHPVTLGAWHRPPAGVLSSSSTTACVAPLGSISTAAKDGSIHSQGHSARTPPPKPPRSPNSFQPRTPTKTKLMGWALSRAW